MLLLRSLPDFATSSAGLHESLSATCDRNNCIIWGRAQSAEFGPYPQTLSIRAVWGGTQYCHLDGRTIAVDDDSFLILNGGQNYSTSIRATQPVESLTICFQPELIGRVDSLAEDSIEKMLDRGSSTTECASAFIENLQPHEGTVSPVLKFIRAHLWRGLTDEAWYDEQLLFLFERMRCRQGRVLKQIDQLALVRPATRREAYRRIALATDFLLTHYVEDVELETLAEIADLSKFHFLRIFRLIHGLTPREYLRRKRVDVALRLLESTRLTIGEVALSVGFGNASKLVSHLRGRTKLSPRQIRTRVMRGQAA
jgi:AraC family transcriptional regulator